jgi:hydrogenase expression/formation protein HypD
MKYVDEFRLPGAVRELAFRIKQEGVAATLMEVCGTHTMAISRAGLRPLLAPQVNLISGPGCPVCVTSDRDIDRAIAIARMPGVILATFGDMMKVPGTETSLAGAVARGARVTVVYSPLEALEIAKREPEMDVVFLGVGFETTAPTVAATVLQARRDSLLNFYVLSLHKLVPPALRALAGLEDFGVDGFILPGHVSAIIGSESYRFLADEFGIPCVITGFEPADILQAIQQLLRMRGSPSVGTEYARAVRPGGNPKALAVMREVFEPADATWRGLFDIPGSGLAFRPEFADFDAGSWEVKLPAPTPDRGCRCGDVLCGRIRPTECRLFGKSCTPDNPIGPCMVSTEGTCASYFLYSDLEQGLPGNDADRLEPRLSEPDPGSGRGEERRNPGGEGSP